MLNKQWGHYSQSELSRHVLAPLYLYISSLFIIKGYWINFIDKGEVAPGKETSRYKRYTENGEKKCHNWHTKPIHIWHRELKSLRIPGCLINIRRSENKRSPPNLGRPQKLIRVINQSSQNVSENLQFQGPGTIYPVQMHVAIRKKIQH